MAVKIFFCYAHEDEPLLIKLKAHLRPLQRIGLIDVWYDRDITAGAEWEQDIKKHLNEANIILLLISPNFMESDYCYGIEMKRALERHERKEAYVIPVILRHVLWKVPPISKLQALPTDSKPILSAGWFDPDEAFYTVAESIQKLAKELDSPSSPFANQITKDNKNLSLDKPSYKPAERQPSTTRRIGLFLDYENILPLLPRNIKHKEVGSTLAAFASRFGEVICRWVCVDPRQYTDPESVQRGLEEAGFSIRLPKGDLLIRQSKNVSDFVLLECITEESIRSQPDIYVLVSGDSDYFEKTISLIESGYTVRVLASKQNLSLKYKWLEKQRRQSRFAQGYVDSDFFIDNLDNVLRLASPGER
jgi:TIR domain/NYN domain